MIDNKQSEFDRDKTGEGQDIEEAVRGWIKYPHLQQWRKNGKWLVTTSRHFSKARHASNACFRYGYFFTSSARTLRF